MRPRPILDAVLWWAIALTVLAAFVFLMVRPAGAADRFVARVHVSTPRPGQTVRVHWIERCDGERTEGRYLTSSPDTRTLPARTCDRFWATAHAWDTTGSGDPHVSVVVS